MAREVLLSFRLQQLQKAEEAAKRVLVAVKKSTELAKDVKRQVSQTTREGLKELRALKTQELERLRGIKSRATSFAAGLREGELDAGELVAPLRVVNKVREKAGAAINLISGGVGSLGSLASLGGPLAAAVAAVALPVIQQVAKAFAEEAAAKLDLMKLELEGDLERIKYEFDYERKLKEDPAFARAEARSAYDLTVKEDAAAAAAGRSDYGAEFLGGF